MAIDPKKQKFLDSLMADMHKKYGKEAITYLGNNAIEEMPRISSQCRPLDRALGGGWPGGRIIEIYGPESSGKTTLCMHAIAEAQRIFSEPAALIDVENAFDPVYAKNLGINVEELIVSQPDDGTQGLNILLDLIEKGLKLIVVDSVAALVPKEEAEAGIEAQQMGVQARLMSKALRKITGPAGRNGSTIIFTNQTREKIGVMFGNPTTTPGGNALKFYASVRVQTTALGVNSEGEAKVSRRIRTNVVKNKTFPPFRDCEFNIRFGVGVDRLEIAIDDAVKYNIIKKSGAWYALGNGDKLGQGREAVVIWVKSNKTVYDMLERGISFVESGNPVEGFDFKYDKDATVALEPSSTLSVAKGEVLVSLETKEVDGVIYNRYADKEGWFDGNGNELASAKKVNSLLKTHKKSEEIIEVSEA